MTKKGNNLTEEELASLHEILKQSKELRRTYGLKEAFYRVFEMKDRASVTLYLAHWLELSRPEYF